MKDIQKEQIQVFINEETKEGFVIGGGFKIIPADYKEQYEKGELMEYSGWSFDRIINRVSEDEIINMKPAFARVTDANSLIIE